jgi:predicted Zn-dependent protease
MKRSSSIRIWAPALLIGIATFSTSPIRLQAQIGQSATQSLLDKAHALEVRGRMDMAAQTWQQVLLSDPNNTQALGGLARAAKLSGNQALAGTYMDRLRAINPNDEGLARVQNIEVQKDHGPQMQQAGKLAQAGQYDQAMQVYREVYGNEPPPGEVALAYYETEAATESGRPHAIAGLRSLSEKYPNDARYQIQLGRILTYNPKTRPEGRKLLSNHPADPQAVEALRQSLLWDSQNPATAADIRAYLAKHNDAQLAQALKESPRTGKRLTPEQQEEQAAERARTAEDQAGYRALNDKRLDEAERRFRESLAKNPENPNALAGMGYIRMQQANFGGAISFLAQAQQNGSKDPGLPAALNTSRFWYTMGEGANAANENDLTASEKSYRAALAMRPSSPEALEGLGGTLLQAQQFEAAEPVFDAFIKVKPQASHAWRGLFLAQSGAGNAARALDTEHRLPAAIRAQLMKDPLYLRTLASTYSAAGRDADAQLVLRAALDLPFPSDAHGVETETQLQYAGLLQQANHLDQAAGLYRQILVKDQQNAEAWKGLVRADHAMNQDRQALQAIESMPPAVYEVAMNDPGFDQTVASIYQSANNLDIAQEILEKEVARQAETGQKPSIPAQLELAGIYLQRGFPQQAYPIYQRVLSANPDRLDAWKGLLSALHSTGRDQEALAQVQQINPAVRLQLEGDVEYLQTVASIYSGLGQPRQSQIFLARVQQYYVNQRTAPPADVEIQNAWLLYNSANDAGLYRELMSLGGRADLTETQRRTVQTIWSSWAVRRANQAAVAGQTAHSLDILNAAARTFPDNPGVLKALAGGYSRAGQNKQAIQIWKSQDLTNATAGDYKAAIGVALAADDLKDAETWLRFGLNAYPKDSQLLVLAAKFEQARGDNNRAATYYRASLNAMPPADPGSELATELSHPASSSRTILPSGRQSQDLSTLLQPGTAASSSATDAPAPPPAPDPLYLPSYGGQYGAAPVLSAPLPAGHSAVPSYMANPSTAPARPSSGARTSLKDYVPQASADEPLPMDGTEMPLTERAASDGVYTLPPGVLTPAAYRQQQISRLTQQAEQPSPDQSSSPHQYLAQQDAPLRPGTLTRNPSGVAQQPGEISNAPGGEVYGPYVPYVPPSHTSVQLGSSPNTVPVTRPEVTDVLPTARYVPNVHSRRRASSNPDAAAARAAAVRRQQSNAVNAGVSAPPAENYDATPAQYSSQPVNAGQSTTSRQEMPRGNSTQQQTAIPQTSQAPATAESFGQQYPQPNTVHPAPRRAPRVARSHPAPAVVTPAPEPVAPAQPAASGLTYPGISQPLGYQPSPAIAPAYPLGQPPTDADLVNKQVPPLRRFTVPGDDQPAQPLTERQQAELDLAVLESSYSSWLGGIGGGRYRSGRIGLDRLADIETSFEASSVIGNSVRLSVIPTAVFLNAGAVDPTVYTGSGTRLGTYLLENTVTPPQQYSNGVGGELQLATSHFAAAVGYTPYNFLVRNVTGRVSFQPTKHLTFYGERQSVKDTQLSYAGLHDPGSASLVSSGNIWGGVVSTGGGLRFDLGDEKSGFYVMADGADLTGYHTLENTKFEGSLGAYFLVRSFPGYGKLNIGATLFGEHYAHNERGMTYGLGGYFSPESYFLAAVPITYTGHYKSNFRYNVSGSIGVQTFEEENALFFPLDTALQTAYSSSTSCTLAASTAHTAACAQYPINSNTGFNYGVNSQGAYRVGEHWFVGGFLSANNTNNYNTVSGGFFIRYMFRPQQSVESAPTGLFPSEGLRPLRIP